MSYPDVYYKPKAEQSKTWALQARSSATAAQSSHLTFWKPEAESARATALAVLDADRHRMTAEKVAECEGWLSTGDNLHTLAATAATDGGGQLAAGDVRVAEGDRLYGLTAYQDAMAEYDAARPPFFAAQSHFTDACRQEDRAMAAYKKVSDVIVALNLPPE